MNIRLATNLPANDIWFWLKSKLIVLTIEELTDPSYLMAFKSNFDMKRLVFNVVQMAMIYRISSDCFRYMNLFEYPSNQCRNKKKRNKKKDVQRKKGLSIRVEGNSQYLERL